MSEIRKWCCGPGGSPGFERMMVFMGRNDRSSRYDAAGWAIFFIWVGVAWLADVGLGVAVATLGMQGLRKVRRVPVERFWVLVGIGFAIAGFWQWSDFQKPLAPFILIAAGVGLFVWKTLPKSRHRGA